MWALSGVWAPHPVKTPATQEQRGYYFITHVFTWWEESHLYFAHKLKEKRRDFMTFSVQLLS